MGKAVGPVRSSSNAVGPVGLGVSPGGGPPRKPDGFEFFRAHPVIGAIVALLLVGAGIFNMFGIIPTASQVGVVLAWLFGLVVLGLLAYGSYWLWRFSRPPPKE